MMSTHFLARGVLCALLVFLPGARDASALALGDLLAAPDGGVLHDPGFWVLYRGFRDFAVETSGGATAVTAAEVDVRLRDIALPSGFAFPFTSQLDFRSERWSVAPGQTMQMRFSYDVLACPECGLWGARLALDDWAAVDGAGIRVESRIVATLPVLLDLPLSARSATGLDFDSAPMVPPGFAWYSAATVLTDIYLCGACGGTARLLSFSEAYALTPLPGSATLLASAVLLALGARRGRSRRREPARVAPSTPH